jgi:hypothetical protein
VKRLAALCSLALGACAGADTLIGDMPRAAAELAIAPYEFHEECGEFSPGDRVDYRFEAKAPVSFEIYYKEGITYVATVSRDEVTEYSGVFQAPARRRYCLRWEAGQRGAILDLRIRLVRDR